ncbi:MAG: fluoride efflux transporter CrcB [Bryobacteraceae bacterium]|nr:fluoride efflux transporter CrcB [Bryobacteraceae bacterium]
MTYLWVALGAALGGVLRYWCYGAAVRLGAELFPWGTLFVNVAGSAVIGFFATMTGVDGRLLVSPESRIFVMAGFCGGFTTFSTFSLETLKLVQDRQWMAASMNVAGSVVLCLAGVWLGHVLAVRLNER